MQLTTHYIATDYAVSKLPLPEIFMCQGRQFQRLAQFHADGMTDWTVTRLTLTAKEIVERTTFTGLIGDCSDWVQGFHAGDTFIVSRGLTDDAPMLEPRYRVEFELVHPYTYRKIGPYVAYYGPSMLEAAEHYDCVSASLILSARYDFAPGQAVPLCHVCLTEIDTQIRPSDLYCVTMNCGSSYYCNSEYVLTRDSREGMNNVMIRLHDGLSHRVMRDLFQTDFRILDRKGGTVLFRGFARNLDTLRTDSRLYGFMAGHQCHAVDYWTDEPSGEPANHPFQPCGHWHNIELSNN